VSAILSKMFDVDDLPILTFSTWVLKTEWLSGLWNYIGLYVFLRFIGFFFQNPKSWLFTFFCVAAHVFWNTCVCVCVRVCARALELHCFSFPCQNGATCTEDFAHGSYRCDCVPGYFGYLCEIGQSNILCIHQTNRHTYHASTASLFLPRLEACLPQHCFSTSQYGSIWLVTCCHKNVIIWIELTLSWPWINHQFTFKLNWIELTHSLARTHMV